MGGPLTRDPTATFRRLVGLGGLVAVVVAWELLALYVFAGRNILPTPVAVVHDMWASRALYWPAVTTTLSEAAQGWLWGNLAAFVVGGLVVGVRTLEGAALSIAAMTYCMPIIAIGPIFQVLLAGNEPKVVMAAMSVFFTTLVAVIAGLRSADRAMLDLVEVLGGSRWDALRKVRLPSALPFVLTGLRVAAPAALLGAIIGEYLGGQQGLGVALISAQQTMDVARAWGVAVAAAALAGIGYGATALVQRLVSPWSSSMAAGDLMATSPRQPHRGLASRVALALLRTGATAGAVIAVWYGAFALLHLDPFFAKTPSDLWRFAVSAPGASENRAQLVQASLVTIRDSAIGLAVGSLAAMALATALVLLPQLEHTIMPIALSLRSVPLVAMTPLLVLLFGRGLLGVSVIVAIVVFFPTLVNMTQGMRATSAESVLVTRAFGASPWRTLRLVRLPAAFPALFASARIAGPAALLGATLAEWLASGKGLGYLMLNAVTSSDFDLLWSGVVAVTLISLAVYALAGFLDTLTSRLLYGAGTAEAAPVTAS